ncbi:MAG: zf-HC2 domain-containing protein [Candidatus Binataceae bacterium]
MNCFEARQDFPAFWRRELSDIRRAELNAHLGQCLKCDQAFRTFATTAPVLHSDHAPNIASAQPRAFTLETAMRTGAPNPHPDYPEPRRWLALCASAIIFIAASTGAYLAVTPPADTLTQALTNPDETSAQQLFGADLPDRSAELGG